jgi:hypothetical protein
MHQTTFGGYIRRRQLDEISGRLGSAQFGSTTGGVFGF